MQANQCGSDALPSQESNMRRPMIGVSEATFDPDDLDGIFEFLQALEVVDAPDELWELVAEHWPAMLDKRKPPRRLMH
jgi:hypothetical protein